MIGRWLSSLRRRPQVAETPAAKSLRLLWSQAALDAAGTGFAKLRPRVRTELEAVTLEANAWLLQAVLADPEDPERGVFVCHGEESEDGWTVQLRLGVFKPMEELSGDGEPMMFPKSVESPENEIFFDDADLAGW